MTAYLALKVVHVISATILFGTGLGTAFYKWIVDRSANVTAIRVVSEKVVFADWLFTTPAIVVQTVTGFALANVLGYPVTRGWLWLALILFCLTGLCWIPAVVLQIRMCDLARTAEREGRELGSRYWAYARTWFWLGVPAFACVTIILWLMVAKP